MKPIFLDFNQHADGAIKDPTQRARIISAALALAVSNLATLPTSPVDAPSTYFNNQVAPAARTVISAWNENMVFDARACMEHLRSFWMLRYTAAHPASRPVYSLAGCFFEAMFGTDTFVSADMQKFYDEHKQAILFLAACAAEIVHSQQETVNA